MNSFDEYIAEANATTPEPLHWAIDSHVPNCILLKKGKKSILGIDFDGKYYTVMTDPKDRSSMGCQKTSFTDAFQMSQDLLNDRLNGGLIPACPSNIRRWLKHGSEKPQDDGIAESKSMILSREKKMMESVDGNEWETATSAIPKDFLVWVPGKNEGEVYLKRRRKNYIKIAKRLPSQQNSQFYRDWIKEKPYSLEWCAYENVAGAKQRLFGEYPDLQSALKDAEARKKMDYSANALVFPDMPNDIKAWLEKGRKNPKAENLLGEAAEHVFKWEFYSRNPNRVSLILDGRYEVAAIRRNKEKAADILPYVVEIYSMNRACEFQGLEKTIADAVRRVAKEVAHPFKLKNDSQMAGMSAVDVVIPPMPTSARLWLDKPFEESILTEKK